MATNFFRTNFTIFLIAIISFSNVAYAQLAGSDTTPGDSCAGFPTGATRVTADADGNGSQITLVCDGTNWNQEGTIVLSKTGAAPNTAGGGLWTAGTGDDIYYNPTTPEVGIGTATPSAELHVVGDIHYTGVIVDISDIRRKEKISVIDRALDKMKTLKGVSFTMKDDPDHEIEYGLIAQDVQKVFPELVKTDKNGMLSLNYIGLLAPTVESIKILSAENDHLRSELSASKYEVQAMKKMIHQLDRRLKILEGKIRPPLKPYNN